MATREEIAKLYIATFNRAADSSGLNYWISDGTTNTTSLTNIEDIASAMLESDEAISAYANLDRQSTVIKMYQNLFNRTVDKYDEGVIYWTSGGGASIDIEHMILALLNGALESDAIIVKNKTEVGLAYADAGLNDTVTASGIMSSVTSEQKSVEEAKNNIIEANVFLDEWNFIRKEGYATNEIISALQIKYGLDELELQNKLNFSNEAWDFFQNGDKPEETAVIEILNFLGYSIEYSSSHLKEEWLELRNLGYKSYEVAAALMKKYNLDAETFEDKLNFAEGSISSMFSSANDEELSESNLNSIISIVGTDTTSAIIDGEIDGTYLGDFGGPNEGKIVIGIYEGEFIGAVIDYTNEIATVMDGSIIGDFFTATAENNIYTKEMYFKGDVDDGIIEGSQIYGGYQYDFTLTYLGTIDIIDETILSLA